MNAKCCGTTKLKLMKPMWHQTIECKLNYLKGYLGDFNFADQIRALRLHDVNLVENGQLVAALFRDYSMLAAAYLLEPVCLRLIPWYGDFSKQTRSATHRPPPLHGRKWCAPHQVNSRRALCRSIFLLTSVHNFCTRHMLSHLLR